MDENGKKEPVNLLEGVVDFQHVAKVAVNIEGQGKMLLIGVEYDEFSSLMVDSFINEAPVIDTTTFVWVGTRQNEQQVFKTTLRCDKIISWEEVTPETWMNYVSTNRHLQQQQSMKGLGLAG